MKPSTLLRFKYQLLIAVLILLYKGAAAQWVPIGPEGGPIGCLAINGNNLVAGTLNNGAFLSTDTGSTWKSLSGLFQLYSGDPAITHAAISDSDIFVEGYSNLFYSNNLGATWKKAYQLDFLTVNALAVNGTNVFAGTLSGIYFSGDHGATWNKVNHGLTDSTITAIVFKGDTVLAGTGSGVFISTNNGGNWVPSGNGLTGEIISMVVSRKNVFAATQVGIFLSADGGVTWQKVNTWTHSTILGLSASDTVLFAGTGNGLYSSTDKGSTWKDVSKGIVSRDIRCLTANDNVAFAGTWGTGVFKLRENKLPWMASNSGLINAPAPVLVNNNTTLFSGIAFEGYGVSAGVYSSNDYGHTWIPTDSGLPVPPISIYSMATSGDTIFAGTWGNGLYISGNNGTSWSQVAKLNFDEIKSILIKDNRIFIVDYFGVRFSSDGSVHWNFINTGLPDSTKAWKLAVSDSGIYLATLGDGVFIFSTKDNTWKTINTGLPTKIVNAFAVNGNSIFAGLNNHIVYKSDDNGNSWVSMGLLPNPINSFAFHGDSVYAGTYSGVFASSIDGGGWKARNEGLIPQLTDMTVHSTIVIGDTLYAGTRKGGVWKLVLPEILTTVKEPGADVITVYPNPAGSRITIKTPAGAKQLLRVCDMTGNILLSKNILTGETVIDCSSWANGIYAICLTDDKKTQAYKLVVIH